MKTNNIVFYVATGLLSALMLFSATNFIFNNAEVSTLFVALGYPAYIIYPLATAKILGLIAIWSNYSKTLKELAYAGFFYVSLLALSAHLNVGDGGFGPAAVALVLWTVSYIFEKKART